MATAGEYDAATAPGKPEAENYAHESTQPIDPRGGKLRVKGPVLSPDELEILRQPLRFPFSGRTAKNRFLKAPMTERLCQWNKEGEEDISARGFPTREYERLYERWGEGEIGVIVTGNIMLRYDAVEGYGNAVLCDDHDGRVAAFRRVTAAGQRHGSLMIAQISHPGRQGNATLNPHPVSASDVQLQLEWMGTRYNQPRPLSADEIRAMVADWGQTAYLCHQAGFDGVQVHCAHGYLLAQFLSPTTNRRTDAYGGGSLANRSRIVFEVLAEIRRRVPDPAFIVGVKLNSVEFQPGGSTPADCRDLCLRLQDAGRVDFVDLSGGTFEGRAFEHKKESTRARESYFIEFADMIRPLLTKTLVYVTGGFRTAAGMADAVRRGACHGVGLGRPLGAEPYLCRDLLLSRQQGALECFVPAPQSTQATGTQIAQIAHGHAAVCDYSDEAEVRRWEAVFRREAERKEKVLPVVDSSGFPLFEAQSGFYYLR